MDKNNQDLKKHRKNLQLLKTAEAELPVDNIVILPIAKFEKIGGKYIVWDDNPGWQEALYNSKYDTWKSTDRPLKNACGQQVIRQILYPEYFAVIPDTI